VHVIDCPDLTKPPFRLCFPGLGGKTAIADVGGPNNINYKENHLTTFKLKELAEYTPNQKKKTNKLSTAHFLSLSFSKSTSQVGLPQSFVIGPGAGSPKIIGVNS
jgi:hypothetical protein